MIDKRVSMLGMLVILVCGAAHAAAPFGLETRPAIGPFLNGTMPELGPGISGNWSAVVAFPKLSFQNALGVLPVPGTNQLVVWEREGRVWTFENRPDVASKKLVLDISKQCQGWDDSGLLGLTFHPDFAANHQMFVWYAWVPPGTVEGDPNHRPRTDKPNHDRLSRFTLGGNGVADPGSELVLIDQETHVVWHKGGGIFFHPRNRFLYLTIGDDEDGSNSQRINVNLLGGMLRIDVDERGGKISHAIKRQPANGHTAHYFIPNDNPFVGTPDALEEFYAIGLRSPHRMTYDAKGDRIFIGDVGDSQREEVDIVEPTDPAGLNFQWPVIEGLRGDLTPPFIGVNKRPVIDYDHGEGSAVIGGFVYRGKEWADDLGGRYIFGDNGTGKIWVLDERTSPPGKMQLCLMPFGPGPNSGSNYTGLSSFGIDADGELYMCQMSSEAGHLFRLKRDGPPPARKPFPKLLSQTGAFSDLVHLTPATGLIPYNVNSPLWSDGAIKSRWMALPAGAKITYQEKGEWAFPDGTVFVKQFDLAVDEAHPEIHRRLETRLLVRDASGAAYGVTYKWRPDNSDADLVTTAITEPITIRTATGGTRAQNWYYPSQNDCIRCHTPAAGYVLGVKTRQINGDFVYTATGVKDNQLRTLNHIQAFDRGVDEEHLSALDKSVPLTETSASAETRIKSYLDSNCAHCHRPGGVHAIWDARFDTQLAVAAIINGRPITRIGLPGSRIVRPRDRDHSLLYERVNSTEPLVEMPPLARNVIDPRAIQVISEWIAGLDQVAGLPVGWIDEDIGQVGQGGEAVNVTPGFAIDPSGKPINLGNAFSFTASGDDIWANSDSFHFAYKPMRGDGEIIAHIASIGDGDSWIKAGVMIRESNQPNARHAFMCITHDQGAAFQRRTAAGGDSAHTPGPPIRAPYWVKLVRSGKSLAGYVSEDSTHWALVDRVDIDLPASALVGLALTSHNNGASVTALADHVEIRESRK